MMTELASVTATITGNAEAIWSVLLDFGRPERLAPTVECIALSGEGEGAVRIVRSTRGFEFHEKLVECNRADYRFRYVILDSGDMPFPGVTSYDCTVLLTPLDDHRTRIVWGSVGGLDGPVEPVRDFLTNLYGNAIRQIALQLKDRAHGRD